MGSNALETHNYYGTRASLKPVVPDLEPDWWQDDERRVYIMELFNQIICQSDSANNLAACAMVTHAYLQTGDQKYKQWVSPVHNKKSLWLSLACGECLGPNRQHPSVAQRSRSAQPAASVCATANNIPLCAGAGVLRCLAQVHRGQ